MECTTQYIKRVEAVLDEDEAVDVQTVMPAFFIRARRVVIEFSERDALDLMVLRMECHGERIRRLKDRLKETGPGTVVFHRNKYPGGLRGLVEKIWWGGELPD